MYIWKKKIPKGSGILYISFTVISLSFLMIVSAVRAQNNIMLSQNGLYTGHEAAFTLYDTSTDSLWDSVISDLSKEYDDFSLCLPLDEPDFIFRGIYVDGRVISPPMLWGSFFDESTSWSGKPTMVAGRSHAGEIREIGGKRCMTMHGVTYEVIGIMGTENANKLNDAVFIDFHSAIRENENSADAEYILDTHNRNDVNEIGQELEMCLSGRADCIMSLPGETEESLVASLISRGVLMDTLYAMMFVSFSLCTVILTGIWLQYRRQLSFSLELCGFRPLIRVFELYKRYGSITFLGYVTGLAVMLGISLTVFRVPVYVSDLLLAFALSAGLGTVIFAFSVWRK